MEQASTVVQLESSVRFEWRSVPCGTDYTFHTSRTLFTRAFTVSLSFTIQSAALGVPPCGLRTPASGVVCVLRVVGWSLHSRVVRGVERLRPLTGLVVCAFPRARRADPGTPTRAPHVRSHRAQTVWRDTARRGAAGSRRRRGDHWPPHAAQAPRRHVHDTTHHSRGTPETRPPNPQHGCPGNPLSALAPHLHHTQRAYLSRQVHQSRYGRRASTHAPLSLLRVSLLTHGLCSASRLFTHGLSTPNRRAHRATLAPPLPKRPPKRPALSCPCGSAALSSPLALAAL